MTTFCGACEQSEEERIDHEHELCQHRLLHCVWEGCEEMVMAKDRRRHREEHVIKTGVFLFTVPGKYTFKVRVVHVQDSPWQVSVCLSVCLRVCLSVCLSVRSLQVRRLNYFQRLIQPLAVSDRLDIDSGQVSVRRSGL